MTSITAPPFTPGIPFCDPVTGVLTRNGLYGLLALQNRTGGVLGISSTILQENIISNTTTIIANTTAITALEDLSVLLADPQDTVDLPPPFWTDEAPTDPPDMGAGALLALALGDVA